ncbi:hypothetical protein PF005_g5542 [Phytophthora fragariae]|nr:hypothetical protein PF009_g8842 [Phytophthora fragariae]KAE9015629.1 hypothetical protein PF011_g7538 [Phytophthora fragariae]KAE9091654.1 hypothetical protein PF007_g18794 [Phytophthora fragariae]KAE9114426.1 hypothetical protein PF006_g19527 [Phytophthora fragariae]KAE9126141.1 hypothetical protein PF010_g5376 [Phytophthora fragariae]
MRVLADDKENYGEYGWMLRKWWVTACATFYAYPTGLTMSVGSTLCHMRVLTKRLEPRVAAKRRHIKLFWMDLA